MGTLYLVRHGQASFGADDYDCLSALGERQSRRLGEYFKLRGLQFEAAITGTLKRQQQTLAGISEGLGSSIATRLWPGLNEYDSNALIAAIYQQPLAKPGNPEMVLQYFRLLRQGLQQWMAGASEPVGMPRYADFVAGVAGALNAHFTFFISPREYGFENAVDILTMTVLGGTSGLVGPILGGTILTLLPELLRFLHDFRSLVNGAVLVLVVLFLPKGIWEPRRVRAWWNRRSAS